MAGRWVVGLAASLTLLACGGAITPGDAEQDADAAPTRSSSSSSGGADASAGATRDQDGATSDAPWAEAANAPDALSNGGTVGPADAATEAGARDSGPSDAPPDEGITPPTGAGAIFVVTGSLLQGHYAYLDNAACGGTGVYDLESDSRQGAITLEEVGVWPVQGASASVKVTVQVGTADDGTYPAGGNGSCSITFTSGAWPLVDAQFACTGLVGIGSGEAFSLSGYLNCH